jgi:hypothetical protein
MEKARTKAHAMALQKKRGASIKNKKAEKEEKEAEALMQLEQEKEHQDQLSLKTESHDAQIDTLSKAADEPKQLLRQPAVANEGPSGRDDCQEPEAITQMRKVMTTSQRRYVSSLLIRVRMLYEKRGLAFPGLCTCSTLSRRSAPDFWLECANDCPFFRNPKACCQSLRMICSGFAAQENGPPQCQPAWG